jgi:dTDP-glucose 4,6-dehydratase
VQSNVMGTFNLLEAVRKLGDQERTQLRFLHVSTDEVYGSLGAAGMFSEEAPYNPSSPYSASKAAADMFVTAYHSTYGLSTAIVNCSNNYGPYQHPEKLIPTVIQCILDHKTIPLYGDGRNVRDWIFVEDHCQALWLALTRASAGTHYNVGANEEWTNLDLVSKLCDLVDELAPDRASDSRNLIAFVKDRPGHDFRYAIDSTKIRKELAWKPTVDFGSGLRRTVQWYIENGTVFRDAFGS